MTEKTGTLHIDQYKFLILSPSVLFIIRNISDKCCRENKNTFYAHFFNRGFYEIMWKNTVEPDRSRTIIL
jgi:hypothetical protein